MQGSFRLARATGRASLCFALIVVWSLASNRAVFAAEEVAAPSADAAAQIARLLLQSETISMLLDQFSSINSRSLLAKEVVLQDEAWSAFASELAAIYRKEFTASEIDELLRFMGSEVGRKWITRSPEIMKALLAGPGLRHMAYVGCNVAFMDAVVQNVHSRAASDGRSVSDDELRGVLVEQVAPKVRPTCQCIMDKVIEKFGTEAFLSGNVGEAVELEIGQLLSTGACPAPAFEG